MHGYTMIELLIISYVKCTHINFIDLANLATYGDKKLAIIIFLKEVRVTN